LDPSTHPRPLVITVLALTFLLAGAYLLAAGLILLLRPGTLAMAAGSYFLSGLETAGPIMFLLGALAYGITGFGLWKLHPLARRAAILIAIYGAVMAVPVLSSAATGQHFAPLVREGIPFILRVLVIFFLLLGPQIEAFKR
jgi:hypothetical protein